MDDTGPAAKIEQILPMLEEAGKGRAIAQSQTHHFPAYWGTPLSNERNGN